MEIFWVAILLEPARICMHLVSVALHYLCRIIKKIAVDLNALARIKIEVNRFRDFARTP